MTYKLSNCIVCKEVLQQDGQLCNYHLMGMIREHRPSFITDDKANYPGIIRTNYIQDPITKVWTKKNTNTI